MENTTLNKIIEDFSSLSLDEKEYVLEIIRKQLIESRREAIAQRAEEAMVNLKEGRVKKGTVQDLYRDLESD
jgi:ribosomal protein S1